MAHAWRNQEALSDRAACRCYAKRYEVTALRRQTNGRLDMHFKFEREDAIVQRLHSDNVQA